MSQAHSDFPNEIKPQINEILVLTIDLTLTLLTEDLLIALSRILTGTVPYYKGKETVKNADDEYIKVTVGPFSGVRQ